MKKRCLSLLLVLTMLLGLLPGSALAAQADSSICVTYTYSEANELVIAPTELTVSAGLAGEYGVGQPTASPTVLDAVVAAHVHELGDAFTPDTAGDYVDAYLSKLFGSVGFGGHVINGHYSADGAGQAVLANGDTVDTFLYSESYMDDYARFFADGQPLFSTDVQAGVTLDLTLQGFNMMGAYTGEVWKPEAQVSVGVLGADGFAPLAVSAEDGTLSCTFPEAGDYLLTTSGPAANAQALVPAWTLVHVSAPLTPEEQARIAQADAEALSLPTEAAGDLDLPVRGTSGKSAIVWTSDNEAVISPKGAVIQQAQAVDVTLTATVTLGTAAVVRTFQVHVPALTAEKAQQLLAAAQEALKAANFALVEYSGESGGGYPYEGSVAVDTNIAATAQAMARKAAPGVTVALAPDFAGSASFAADGTILYGEKAANADVSFVLTLAPAQPVTVNVAALPVPAHSETKAEAVADKLAQLTEEALLNGQSADHVTDTLRLDAGSSFGMAVNWTSDHEAVTLKTGTSSATGQLHAIVRPAYGEADALVHLTATVDYASLNKDLGICEAGPMPAEADRSRTFTLTVPAYTEEEWNALTAELAEAADRLVIKPFGAHGANDPAADLTAVTGDLMLPAADGFHTVWTSQNEGIAAPQYQSGRASVTRPALRDAVGTLTATVSSGSCSVQRVFAVTVPGRSVRAYTDAVAARLLRDGLPSDWNAPWFVCDLAEWSRLTGNAPTLTAEARQAVLSTTIASVKEAPADASGLARAILVCRALGVDPTQLYTADNTHLDAPALLRALLKDEEARTGHTGAYSIYTLPYVLMALRQDASYAAPEELDLLIASALEQNVGESPWGYDGIAPCLLALAPYYESREEVRTALDRVSSPEYLAAYQGSTGAIEAYGSPNPNSTGLAIMGLTALGKDPASYEKDGKNLVEGLLALTNEAGDWFLYADSENAAATEQALRGLLGLVGMQETGKPYAIYDFSGNPAELGRESWTGSPVTFHPIPAEARITLTDAEEQTVAPVTGHIYDLAAGTYAYTAALEGYTSRTGTLTVTDEQASAHAPLSVNVSLPREPVTDRTIEVTLRVMVHDAAECGNAFTYKDNADRYTALVDTGLTLRKGVSAFDALDAALTKAGLSYVEVSPGYVGTIGGLSELDHGPLSGWMYLVDGTAPQVTSRDYLLADGEEVVFYYTDDYTRDYGSEEFPLPSKPKPELPPQFADVAENAWYADTVRQVVKLGLMEGTGADRFAPEMTMTRSMLVSTLYRLAGSPAAVWEARFPDVADGAWYTDAVLWAARTGVAAGYPDGRFGPDDPVTREQAAALLLRYAALMGRASGQRAELTAFPDAAAVSPYALEAVAWAVAEKLMVGTPTGLTPQGTASRAEVAALLVRFAENVAK